jgi:hypothetical protein
VLVPNKLIEVLEKLKVAHVIKTFPAFMGTRGSLPCSQEPAIGMFPQFVLNARLIPYFFNPLKPELL